MVGMGSESCTIFRFAFGFCLRLCNRIVRHVVHGLNMHFLIYRRCGTSGIGIRFTFGLCLWLCCWIVGHVCQLHKWSRWFGFRNLIWSGFLIHSEVGRCGEGLSWKDKPIYEEEWMLMHQIYRTQVFGHQFQWGCFFKTSGVYGPR